MEPAPGKINSGAGATSNQDGSKTLEDDPKTWCNHTAVTPTTSARREHTITQWGAPGEEVPERNNTQSKFLKRSNEIMKPREVCQFNQKKVQN